MPTLAQTAGLKLAALFVQSLVTHYYGKVIKDPNNPRVPLRDEELLYDQVFYIVKRFMQDATIHTVEEFQSFTKTRALLPPWANIVRTFIPLSCCDAAASHLIEAFGGKEVTTRTVGGTKWWQVRGIQGVAAEWITAAAKDCEKSPRCGTGTAETKQANSRVASSDEGSGAYGPGMDETPCMLYIHGGAYYFGSADGRKSSLERYARKIRGRLFTVDYRLAPQFPFPCAIQDVLAAYLYLIQPPIGASHLPVDPNKIVICGDSSGGGLALALLQVIRDAGLPLPAGGVLVSPWCDLTHSFHSIITNTDTDVLPDTGLSLHKPSTLWPPPSEDFTSQIHDHLRIFANGLVQGHGCEGDTPSTPQAPTHKQDDSRMHPQFQFYAENKLLRHPLVSPVLAYLGGLPPLFFVAGDGEVLRDEIVYTAHRAAHPEKFPLSRDVKEIYPLLGNVKDKMRSTAVHVQIYDDAAHILPLLFPFTTPGKFCIRAIAAFIRQVTNAPSQSRLVMPMTPAISTSSTSSLASLDSSALVFVAPRSNTLSSKPAAAEGEDARERSRSGSKRQIIASISAKVKGRSAQIFRFGREEISSGRNSQSGSPNGEPSSVDHWGEYIYAGDRVVYNTWMESQDHKVMIRERVSTHGIVRTLEHEDDLPAFTVHSNLVGVIPEGVLQRYLAGKENAEKKFVSITKNIEKQRARNVERARYELAERAAALRPYLTHEGCSAPSSMWRLAWALDASECPPPSSIAGRLDTEEALWLAQAEDLLLGVAAGSRDASSCVLKGGAAAIITALSALTWQRTRGGRGSHGGGACENESARARC